VIPSTATYILQSRQHESHGVIRPVFRKSAAHEYLVRLMLLQLCFPAGHTSSFGL